MSLKVSDTRVNLNGSVTVTAHLEDFRKTASKVLKIYATPCGEQQGHQVGQGRPARQPTGKDLAVAEDVVRRGSPAT